MFKSVIGQVIWTRYLVLVTKMEKETTFFIPKQVLQDYGCKRCVWKQYGQCPKGYTEEHEFEELGYCQEFADFIFSLYTEGDGVSAIKGKLLLYTQELAAQSDGKEYLSLLRKYKDLKAQGMNYNELGELRLGIEASKMWWHRLTESVTKGLDRISDRERRSKDMDKDRKQLSVHDINRVMAESAKVLLEHKNKEEIID